MSDQQPKFHEWFHKFLINFAMWAFALIGVAYGIRYIVFTRENCSPSEILPIVFAVLLILLSLFTVKVRFDLAAFRPQAPKELLFTCLAAAAAVFLVNLSLYLPGAIESMGRAVDAGIFAIWGFVLYRYYSQRPYLFKE